MPASSSLERNRSIITVILALFLAVGSMSFLLVPSLLQNRARQEREELIRVTLAAIDRDNPEALQRVFPRLKPDVVRWDRVKAVASHRESTLATDDRAAVRPLMMEFNGMVRVQGGEGIPLFIATYNGRTHVVKFLIEQGVDVNVRHPMDGATALFSAVRNQHLHIARMLLENGANPNLPLKATPYRRVMHIGPLPGAVPNSIGEYERRTEALSNEIREKNEAGTTPLMCAAYSGSEAMARLLLKHGADPDQKTASGKTALDFARRFGHPKTLKLLKNPDALVIR